MGWMLPAAIVASSIIGAQAAKKGSKVEYGQVPETEAAKIARGRLLDISEGELPEIPRREIAPLKPLGEERRLARTTAKELIQPQDIFQLPEVQGIIQEANIKGNLLANRLSRMLQASGNITSSTGRDVLGRTVTEIQKSIASALAPFAMEERARRRGMIPVLEGLGLTEEERARGFSQAELDALFGQEYETSKQLETFTIPLLQSIIGLQPAAQPMIQGQQPSMITQLAPIIGPLLTASLNKGGGTSGYSFLPGQGTNIYQTSTWGGGL